jgi:predicted metal-dependent hydrolase
MIKQNIQFGSQKIEFTLYYSKRKTLGITVTSEMEVIVKAPEGTPVEKIKDNIRRKAPWIIKQQSYFISFLPKMPPRRYIGGEAHLYMGRHYTLKIVAGKKEEVRYKGRILEVVAKDKSRVKELLTRWYRDRAKEKFSEIAEPLISRFHRYNVEPTGLYIQEMSKRWGSCTPKGKIILNIELIKAPKGCIEYVIIHELCHLVHHNHTQKFIELQRREMPDWEKWKNKLENLLA